MEFNSIKKIMSDQHLPVMKIIIQSGLGDYRIGAEGIAYSSFYFENIDCALWNVMVALTISLWQSEYRKLEGCLRINLWITKESK